MMGDSFNRDQGIPLHHQLSAILRSNIVSGQYPFGSTLPGETTLMTLYGVSRATVRRALLSIEDERLVNRQQGKGTAVIWQPSPLQQSDARSHIENVERIYVGTRVEFLGAGDILASDEVSRALGLMPGAMLYRIERLRWADDVPLWHLINYLPLDCAEAMPRKSLETSSLISALGRAGYSVERAEDRIGALLADAIMAVNLRVPFGAALTEVSRTLVTDEGVRIAFQKLLIVPERHKLRFTVDTSRTIPNRAMDEAGAYEDFLN